MNEKDLFTQLKKDWDQLDELSEHSAPSINALKEQIIIAKIEKRRAFRKELCLFILTALIVLSAFTVAVYKIPVIFMAIQIVALIGAPILFFFLRKRNSEGRILS